MTIIGRKRVTIGQKGIMLIQPVLNVPFGARLRLSTASATHTLGQQDLPRRTQRTRANGPLLVLATLCAPKSRLVARLLRQANWTRTIRLATTQLSPPPIW